MSERQGHDDERSDAGRSDSPDDDPVLPGQTADDMDRGWGDREDDDASDDERLIREKPPHW